MIALTRLLKGLADFLAGDHGLARQAGDHVAAAHFHGLLFAVDGGGRADLDLDPLGGLLADHQVVGLFHVVDDGLVHVVAGDADGFADGDVGQGDDGDFGRAAADVHDHGGGRLGDGQARADARGHGLFDEVDPPCPGPLGGVEHRPLFHGGDARGDGDDHARADERPLPWTLRMK